MVSKMDMLPSKFHRVGVIKYKMLKSFDCGIGYFYSFCWSWKLTESSARPSIEHMLITHVRYYDEAARSGLIGANINNIIFVKHVKIKY